MPTSVIFERDRKRATSVKVLSSTRQMRTVRSADLSGFFAELGLRWNPEGDALRWYHLLYALDFPPESRALRANPREHEGYYLGAGAPLSNAAAVGRMDIVQLLLDHGADPNLPEEQFAPKGKALYSAVYHGHYEIAKLLLERGAFPNPPVESSGDALWICREWRPDKRMEQLLLSYGAAPPQERRHEEDWPTREHNWLRISPLHEAARKGDVKEAEALLESGADLTARDEHLRSTPLAWAAKYGRLEMVKFLLRRGAPKSLPDDPPWATPLAWATSRA